MGGLLVGDYIKSIESKLLETWLVRSIYKSYYAQQYIYIETAPLQRCFNSLTQTKMPDFFEVSATFALLSTTSMFIPPELRPSTIQRSETSADQTSRSSRGDNNPPPQTTSAPGPRFAPSSHRDPLQAGGPQLGGAPVLSGGASSAELEIALARQMHLEGASVSATFSPLFKNPLPQRCVSSFELAIMEAVSFYPQLGFYFWS